jgi:hypothetical protein
MSGVFTLEVKEKKKKRERESRIYIFELIHHPSVTSGSAANIEIASIP